MEGVNNWALNLQRMLDELCLTKEDEVQSKWLGPHQHFVGECQSK